MKYGKLLSLVLSAIMLLSLSACGGDAAVPAPAVAEAPAEGENSAEAAVTDMIGRALTVTPGSYKRVLCIGAGALRMYSYIGDVSLLCGVEDIDNEALAERPKMFDSVARPYVLAYGNDFAALPSCGTGGPNAQTAEAERILSCAPDIVISEYEDTEKENALQAQLGVPVVTLRTGPDGVFDEAFKGSLNLLGVIFCREDRAEKLISFVEAEAAEISARSSAVADSDKPAVYICGLGNWGTANHLMTAQNYAPFRIANVRNVMTGLGKDGIQPIEAEKFVDAGDEMDIIIVDAAAVKNIMPLYAEDSTMFDSCRAWRNGDVYLEMAYNAYYTNFEIALINTWFIAKTVYPELFEDIDISAKTDEITEMFLGEKLAEKIFACPQSFGGYGKIDTADFFADSVKAG